MSIPSPCKGACKLDADRVYCTGCLRTLDEIKQWSGYSDHEKEAVWKRLLALAPIVKMKTCQACGSEFQCGVGGAKGGCWCQDLPPLMTFPTDGQDCFCPACLATELTAKQAENSQ